MAASAPSASLLNSFGILFSSLGATTAVAEAAIILIWENVGGGQLSGNNVTALRTWEPAAPLARRDAGGSDLTSPALGRLFDCRWRHQTALLAVLALALAGVVMCVRAEIAML